MSDDRDNKRCELKKIERNERGDLVAYLAGADAPVEKVKVARCFPWSLRDQYISIRDADGKELALLETLDVVDEATRELVRQELREGVFVPKSERITKYVDEFDVISITAETDRGEVNFQMRSRQDVRALSATRAIFRDVDGNLYEVPDFDQLDRVSQRHIEQLF